MFKLRHNHTPDVFAVPQKTLLLIRVPEIRLAEPSRSMLSPGSKGLRQVPGTNGASLHLWHNPVLFESMPSR